MRRSSDAGFSDDVPKPAPDPDEKLMTEDEWCADADCAAESLAEQGQRPVGRTGPACFYGADGGGEVLYAPPGASCAGALR